MAPSNQPFCCFAAKQRNKKIKEMIITIKHDCIAGTEERYAALNLKYLVLLNFLCKSSCDLPTCLILFLWPGTTMTNVKSWLQNRL